MRVHKHKQLALKQTRCEKTGSPCLGDNVTHFILCDYEPYRCLMTEVVSRPTVHMGHDYLSI